MEVTAALASVGQWSLLVAVAVLAVIGFLYLTRGTVVRHVRAVGGDSRHVSPAEAAFPFSLALHTGAVLQAGHRVEIALDGDGTYERLWKDLESAEESISMQIYYRQRGRMAAALRPVLRARAAAGVRVYILYDAFGTSHMPASERRALEAAGIEVVPFRPIRLSTLHLAQNRSHVRGIVIDGRVAWTGGFGIDDKWFGDGRTGGSWRETNVRFEGPAVAGLQAAFAAAWAEATGVLLTTRVHPEYSGAGPTIAGLLHTQPTVGSTAAERFLALSIAGATKSLYITNAYFIPDASFVAMLAGAARRGVDVRVLTAGPRTDVRVARFAGRARYEELLAAGVRIYEWQPTVLHSKTFVIDGIYTSIGSMNFDNRSLSLNDEATLLVVDETIGSEMDEIFHRDLEHANEIRLLDFRGRHHVERAFEHACRMVAPLL